MERKLSTILASDVVGFSKMMAANEEPTLRDLSRRRQVIDGVVAEHGGKIFGSARRQHHCRILKSGECNALRGGDAGANGLTQRGHTRGQADGVSGGD